MFLLLVNSLMCGNSVLAELLHVIEWNWKGFCDVSLPVVGRVVGNKRLAGTFPSPFGSSTWLISAKT